MAIATPDNITSVLPICFFASFGVGAVIIPCAIIAQIICPDDLIATITAITLAIRYVGGAIGFTIYYNVFYRRVTTLITNDVATKVVVGQLGYLQGFGMGDLSYITNLVQSLAQAQYQLFEFYARAALAFPGLRKKNYTYEEFTQPIIDASHAAFADAYRYPYFISIAFGGLTFICACFLGDIKPFLDDHIAVVV